MICNKEMLIAVFSQIIQLIKEDDSFSGTVTYDCMQEGLRPGEFKVTGMYRTGNSMGQGGMIILDQDDAQST